ncbi:MAG: adenylate kinase [Phycisphaerae bacterium]|nr:adenylate kinase [Phycisphaerae bacterium]HAW94937.1 adenylate kinase [Phycisphaerales bacterium]
MPPFERDAEGQPCLNGPLSGRRLSIIGCSGSGKTTLSRRLGDALEIPRLELDALHHQADWTPLERERFRQAVDEFMRHHEDWIIDGNYEAVADLVRSRCTDIIWLDLSLPRVLLRLFIRSLRRSVGRVELWNGNRERLRDLCSLDPERSMVTWALQTHARHPARFEALRTDPTLSHVTFHRIRSPREAADLVRSVERTLG